MMENKPRILVVDDEPDIVDSLKDYLGRKGYAVVGALSGEEALNILEKEKADLILMDIMMPGIKGTDASRIIKQKYPSVKVIILTAYPQEAGNLVKDDILEGVFAKPISMLELYDRLSSVIHPTEEKSVDANVKQGIKARVLLIKAKVLVLESSGQVFDSLKKRLGTLNKRGEYYELNNISSLEQLPAVTLDFKPDLIMANTTFINAAQDVFQKQIVDNFLLQGKMILYTVTDPASVNDTEVERIIKTLEAYSFKNGLIEVKWIEI